MIVRHRLDLVVRLAADMPAEGAPELVPLIDGADVVLHTWGGRGRDPDDLLGPGSPLLAVDGAHDAVLLRCGCGEEGCGALIVQVRQAGDEVVWDHFRDGSAHKSDPLSHTYDRLHGEPFDKLTEFRFDADAYRAELRRAHEDRAWESPERTTARILKGLLVDPERNLAGTGWTLVWAKPGATELMAAKARRAVPGVSVSLRSGGRQISLSYPWTVIDPILDARAIADTILNDSPGAWPVTFRGGQLREWDDHPNL